MVCIIIIMYSTGIQSKYCKNQMILSQQLKAFTVITHLGELKKSEHKPKLCNLIQLRWNIASIVFLVYNI